MQNRIYFQQRHDIFHTCATCSELPSNKSTVVLPAKYEGWAPAINLELQRLRLHQSSQIGIIVLDSEKKSTHLRLDYVEVFQAHTHSCGSWWRLSAPDPIR